MSTPTTHIVLYTSPCDNHYTCLRLCLFTYVVVVTHQYTVCTYAACQVLYFMQAGPGGEDCFSGPWKMHCRDAMVLRLCTCSYTCTCSLWHAPMCLCGYIELDNLHASADERCLYVQPPTRYMIYTLCNCLILCTQPPMQ
jgi:hypothetical protein